MSINPEKHNLHSISDIDELANENIVVSKMTSLSSIKIFIIIASIFTVLTQYSLICCERKNRIGNVQDHSKFNFTVSPYNESLSIMPNFSALN